jgi:hypothetical protein
MRVLQIVGIGVRLFAVILVIYIARYSVGLVSAAADSSIGTLFTVVLFTILLPIIAALLLWFFPLSIASKLVPRVPAEEALPALSSHDFQTIGFSLIGLWLLATTLTDIVYWATIGFLMTRPDYRDAIFAPEQIGSMVATAAQFAIAAWLLVGSQGLIVAIHRIRYAGAPADPPA